MSKRRPNPQQRLAEQSQVTYREQGERAALRCGLGDAATLCDWLAEEIQHEHRGRGGKGAVTKRGMELSAAAKRCGDAIWAMRELVTVAPRPSDTGGK